MLLRVKDETACNWYMNEAANQTWSTTDRFLFCIMWYEDDDFYVDLVFYHSVLKCHVLIDLKLGKLTHGDVGQMDSYIRMFDAQYKRDDDNPTIGLILCSEKNDAVVKYSVLADAKQIFASKYELALPKPEELAYQIKMDRLLIEERMKNSEEEL